MTQRKIVLETLFQMSSSTRTIFINSQSIHSFVYRWQKQQEKKFTQKVISLQETLLLWGQNCRDIIAVDDVENFFLLNLFRISKTDIHSKKLFQFWSFKTQIGIRCFTKKKKSYTSWDRNSMVGIFEWFNSITVNFMFSVKAQRKNKIKNVISFSNLIETYHIPYTC